MFTISSLQQAFLGNCVYVTEATFKFVNKHVSQNTRHRLNVVTEIAKHSLYLLKMALLHLCTLGLYTVYNQRKKIKLLTKNLEESERIKTHLKSSLLVDEAHKIKVIGALEIAQEEKERALKTIKELQTQIASKGQLLKISEDHCTQLQTLHQESLTKQQEIVANHQKQVLSLSSSRSIGGAISSLFRPESTIQNLKSEAERLVKENAALQTQTSALKQALHLATLEKARLASEKIALDTELKQLTNQLKERDQETHGIGPIPRKYQHLAEETEDPSEIEFKRDLVAPYNSCTSIDQLIKVAFDHTFDTLVIESKDKPYIHFNRSKSIIDFPPNMQALYRLMIFNLLSGAKLEQDGCDGSHIVLNSHGITVNSSDPEKVMLKEYSFNPLDPAHPILINKQKIRFKHHDAWSPKEGDRDLINGIDPVSVKLILQRLSEKEIAYLRLLLLEPLIQDSEPLLKDAWRLARLEERQSQLLSTSYELICDIALSVSKNFSSTFSHGWQEKACSDEPVPLDKTSLPPSTASTPVAEYVEWVPLYAYIPEEIHENLVQLKQLLSAVWCNMSSELVANPILSPSAYLSSSPSGNQPSQLENHYYWTHRIISPHGCLFSAMATHLFQTKGDETGISRSYIALIKKSIANFLEAHPEEFTDDMKVDTHLDRTQYIKWLKGTGMSRDTYAMGDVELKLIGKVFGIRIEVLSPGIAIKPSNEQLITPEPLMSRGHIYGPNTKEKLIIYNSPGYSYYSLMPKLRPDKRQDDPELQAGLKHIKDFWQRKHKSTRAG